MRGRHLDRENNRELILRYEARIDELLAAGEIDQEAAWDGYFGLLHECDLRWMWDDRDRILTKIDVKRYDPFLSKDPGVVMIARIRGRPDT